MHITTHTLDTMPGNQEPSQADFARLCRGLASTMTESEFIVTT